MWHIAPVTPLCNSGHWLLLLFFGAPIVRYVKSGGFLFGFNAAAAAFYLTMIQFFS